MLNLGERTALIGVLNVAPEAGPTPGGLPDPDRVLALALKMEQDGADLLDLGTEAARLGTQRLTEDEELKRLVPVLERVRPQIGIPIALDTSRSAVARRALELGIDVISDPSGFTSDIQIPKIVGQFDAGLLVNQMRAGSRQPGLPDPVANTYRELDSAVGRALRGNVQRPRMALEAGLGHTRKREEAYQLLLSLPRLAQLELPVVADLSRPLFLTQKTPEETKAAVTAGLTVAITQGAHVVRVTEVREARVVADLADTLLQAAATPPDTQDNNASRAARPRSFGPGPRR